jgi:hypothetical protein
MVSIDADLMSKISGNCLLDEMFEEKCSKMMESLDVSARTSAEHCLPSKEQELLTSRCPPYSSFGDQHVEGVSAFSMKKISK